MENKSALEFIYKAVEDTANTIRALDAKINYLLVAISLNFALMGLIFQKILDIYNYYKSVPLMSGTLLVMLITYTVTTTRCVFFSYKTLSPKDNPEDHVDITNVSPNKLWYLNNKDGKISISLNDYYNIIKNLNTDELILSSSFELMKLSYIRNVKLQYVNKSVSNLMMSLAAFLVIIILVFLQYFILI